MNFRSFVGEIAPAAIQEEKIRRFTLVITEIEVSDISCIQNSNREILIGRIYKKGEIIFTWQSIYARKLDAEMI
ncbi:MAG: hypothetical protein ACI84C_002642 [Flavobacteriales bacterium]